MVTRDQRGGIKPYDGERSADVRFRASDLRDSNDSLLKINPSATCEDCGYPALAHAMGDSEIICPPRPARTDKMRDRDEQLGPVYPNYGDPYQDANFAARLVAVPAAELPPRTKRTYGDDY